MFPLKSCHSLSRYAGNHSVTGKIENNNSHDMDRDCPEINLLFCFFHFFYFFSDECRILRNNNLYDFGIFCF